MVIVFSVLFYMLHGKPVLNSHNNFLFNWQPIQPSIDIGTCMPSSCSSEDIKGLLRAGKYVVCFHSLMAS